MADLRWSVFAVPGVSAVIGGAVGALLTVSLWGGKAPSGDVPAQPERLGSAAAAATAPLAAPLDERVEALERSLRALALKESLARASAAPQGSAAAGATPPLADVAPIVDNPVFEAAVRDVMDRAEQDRELERDAQRAEWRKRAAEQWVGELGEKLRLTDVQKAKVTEIANGFWTKLRDLRPNDVGPPASRQERRERAEALRKSTETELATVLDASQLTSYRELDEASQLGSPRNLRAGQRGSSRAAP